MKTKNKLTASSGRMTRLVSLLSIDSQRWLAEHPEHEPYFSEGKWRIPYLVSSAGGSGGGVGEFSHPTLPGAVLISRNYLNGERLELPRVG